MFKKLLSSVGLVAILSIIIPTQVLAASIDDDRLISTVTLTVTGGTPATFEPALSQTLAVAAGFDTTNFGTQLQTSTGYVVVKQGATVLRTLAAWSSTSIPTAIPGWDGKAIDNTAAAQTICGSSNMVCPDGNYVIEAHVEYPSGVDSIQDTDTAAFSIVTTPAVNITALAVSPVSFNALTQTADVSFTTSANGFVTIEVLDGTAVVKNLLNNLSLNSGSHTKTQQATLAWDGKNTAGQIVTNKIYQIRATSRQTATGAVLDTESVSVTLATPSGITIDTFGVSSSGGGTTFDPSSSGLHQVLDISYTLNKVVDSVQIEIKNVNNELMKSFASSALSTTFSWNGEQNGLLVAPGVYTVTITAAKTGDTTVTRSATATIAYNNSSRGEIQNPLVNPNSFDPDVDDTVITFKNSRDSNITVKIIDSNRALVREFTSYKNNNYSADSSHNVVWDGKNNSGSKVSTGSYKAVINTRNNFGVVETELAITVNGSGSSVATSNAHIAGVSFSPSSTFEPAKDDELKIEYDVKVKLDELKIVAVRGAVEVEISDEDDVDKDSNVEVTWDGTDNDDEYVDQGSWRIEFRSKAGSTSLKASKSIKVEYQKPNIDEIYLSKKEFDNDQDEFTYVIFKINEEAEIDIELLESNSKEDDLQEDFEVDKDKWYAVFWDGDSFGFEDDVDIKIIAGNKANTEIFDTEKIAVNLEEDDVSSSRSNVTQDFISPVIAEPDEEMEISYTLDEKADVKVSIHKGTSGTGSEVIKLVDVEEQDEGEHTIVWNGRDKNGNKLSKGVYTYKIISQLNSSETETGLFVIGDVGEIDGGPASSGSGNSASDNDNNGGSGGNSNVIVDGGSVTPDPDPVSPGKGGTGAAGSCADFSDVPATFQNCDAIKWVKENNVFSGYSDGTFRPFAPITRSEILKVIMEAVGIGPDFTASGNLGFSDVEASAWYVPYIKAAKGINVFQGDAGKNTARPGDTVNRAEALKLAFETLKAASNFTLSTCTSSYSDVTISNWYAKYACGAKKYKLFEGSNLFAGALSTRGEMAEMLYKLSLAGLL